MLVVQRIHCDLVVSDIAHLMHWLLSTLMIRRSCGCADETHWPHRCQRTITLVSLIISSLQWDICNKLPRAIPDRNRVTHARNHQIMSSDWSLSFLGADKQKVKVTMRPNCQIAIRCFLKIVANSAQPVQRHNKLRVNMNPQTQIVPEPKTVKNQ